MGKLNNILERIKKISEGKKSKIKVGDIVLFYGGKKEFRVTNILKTKNGTFIDAVRSDGKRGVGSSASAVNVFDVYKKGESSIPTDENGDTAFMAAKKIMKKFVIISTNRVVNETFGFVKGAGKLGTLTVEHYMRGVIPNPSSPLDQETYKADPSIGPDEVLKFKPMLFNGQWRWSNKKEGVFIKGVLGRDGKLSKLLD